MRFNIFKYLVALGFHGDIKFFETPNIDLESVRNRNADFP
jgi:hypothetical protein